MLRELPDGYALLVRGGRAPVIAKLPEPGPTGPISGPGGKAAPSTGHPPPRRLPRPASSPCPPTRGTGRHRADGNGHRASGNGHREAAGFPWGGEDR